MERSIKRSWLRSICNAGFYTIWQYFYDIFVHIISCTDSYCKFIKDTNQILWSFIKHSYDYYDYGNYGHTIKAVYRVFDM